MFRTDQFGRLDYTCFLHYSLPELVRRHSKNGKDEPRHAEFVRGDGPHVKYVAKDGPDFTRPLFRLRWPGESTRPETTVPVTPEMSRISWLKGLRPGIEGKVSIAAIWDRWVNTPGAILPERIAYHVAVNPPCVTRKATVDEYPACGPDGRVVMEHSTPTVAGLPGERVREVLDTEFALDANALATLKYLKWHAESLFECPFFQGFDTNVRETLQGLHHEAVRLYFYLLADYRYDVATHWWDRGQSRFVWQRLATYLHWVGRTGSALYGNLAHIRPAEGIRPDVVAEHMQDVVDGNLEWIHSIDYMVDEVVEIEKGPLIGDPVRQEMKEAHARGKKARAKVEAEDKRSLNRGPGSKRRG